MRSSQRATGWRSGLAREASIVVFLFSSLTQEHHGLVSHAPIFHAKQGDAQRHSKSWPCQQLASRKTMKHEPAVASSQHAKRKWIWKATLHPKCICMHSALAFPPSGLDFRLTDAISQIEPITLSKFAEAEVLTSETCCQGPRRMFSGLHRRWLPA